MRVIALAWRGCRSLPHVGEHPGTLFLLFFIGCGAAAGGWAGVTLMSVFMLPIYLYGAYERAKLSDSITNTELQKKKLI